jgi:PAS domain S-box-containing protein
MNRSVSSLLRRIPLSLVVGVVVGLTCWSGIWATREAGRVASIWLSNGLLLGVLLSVPSERWRACLGLSWLANVVANLAAGDGLQSALVLSLCNTAEVMLAAYPLRQQQRNAGDELTHPAAVRVFFLYALVLAPSVSAAVASLYLTGAQWSVVAPQFLVWYLADALGIVIVTPLVLAVARTMSPWSRLRSWSAMDWLAPLSLIAIALVVFVQTRYPLLFLVLLPLMLMAFRLGPSGVAAGMALLALIAVPLTVMGRGPFALIDGATLSERVLFLQLFLAVACALALPAALVLRQRERLDHSLRQAEERFRFMAGTMPFGLLIGSPDGTRIEYANPYIEALTGRGVARLQPEQWAEVIHSEDMPTVARLQVRALADGQPFELELRAFDAARGGYRWHQMRGQLMRDAQGHAVHWYQLFFDIDDLKQAQSRLAATAQSYETLVAKSPGMVFRADMAKGWQLLYVSERVEEITGYPASHFLEGHVPWSAVMLPEDVDATQATLQRQIAAGGIEIRTRYRVRRRDGGVRWCDVFGRVNAGPDGEQWYEGILLDVTEQEAADQALRQSSERYRTLVSNIPGMVFRCRADETWSMLWVSNQAQALVGYTPEEFTSGQVSFSSLMLEEDRATTHATLSAQAAAGGSLRTYYRLRHLDGSVVWCQGLGQMVTLTDGTPGFEGVILDVGERRRAEQALRESEERYRLMAESLSVTIWTARPDGDFDYLNGEALRYFGLPMDDLLGSRWASVVHLDDVAAGAAAWAKSIRTGEPYQVEMRTRRHDGQYRWHLVRALPMRAPDGHILQWLGSNVDVEDLRRARQTAEQAAQMKAAFLANMSHEIRTPMNAIVGMTSILLDTRLTAEQAEAAEVIRSSGEHLLMVINDILDFSKIDAGQLEMESLPFALRDGVESALDLVSAAALAKNLEVGYLLHPGVPDSLIGDIGRLRQVLLNLLSNAVKFTPSGGQVSMDVSARVLDEGRHEIEFRVQDSGVGIAPEAIGRLFTPFMQADASTTRKFGGSGLGLSISRRLVELMGGAIRVESGPGRGACFIFTIVAMAAPEVRPSHLTSPVSSLRGMRALIVDDIEINRRILLHYTGLWGMQARATASPLQALNWIKAGETFDVALLDYHMPGFDGLELVHRMRPFTVKRPFPILILSSVAISAADRELVAGTLVKPIKPSRLLDAVQELIDAAQAVPASLNPVPVSEFPRELGSAHPLRVLVAEDNIVNQKVVGLLLGRLGYSADFAANGREAITAIERQRYDLVLMDVQMPEMDGLEATREICRRWPADSRPRIVGLTANATTENRRECLAAGMDDYLSKPLVPQFLIDALRKVQRRS